MWLCVLVFIFMTFHFCLLLLLGPLLPLEILNGSTFCNFWCDKLDINTHTHAYTSVYGLKQVCVRVCMYVWITCPVQTDRQQIRRQTFIHALHITHFALHIHTYRHMQRKAHTHIHANTHTYTYTIKTVVSQFCICNIYLGFKLRHAHTRVCNRDLIAFKHLLHIFIQNIFLSHFCWIYFWFLWLACFLICASYCLQILSTRYAHI